MAADQLLTTANGWHALSAELLTAAAPSGLGSSSQASALAVNAVHADVAAAGEAFAARTQITASKPRRQASPTRTRTLTRKTSSTRSPSRCRAQMTTALATLSTIQTWDVEHLTEAADHWDGTADRWEDVSVQVWQQSHGLDWEDQAREALVARTTTDKTTIMAKSDQLREAAKIARRGAGDIDAAKSRVLYAVEDAHNAGFVVGEDLSVADTRTTKNPAELAARQSQAQGLAADIRDRAAQLVGVDNELGANLTGTAGGVGETTFADNPINYDGKPIDVDASPRNGTIQLAGHGFKLDGGAPPPPPRPGLLDQYEQSITSSVPQAPPPIPMPSSGGPPKPFVPDTPGPIPTYTPPPSFGQCVGGEVKGNIGKEMVKDGFSSAITGSIKGFITGGAGGAALTPELAGAGAIPGSLGGGVLGFVGGFMKGLIEAPLKSAGKAALDCVTH